MRILLSYEKNYSLEEGAHAMSEPSNEKLNQLVESRRALTGRGATAKTSGDLFTGGRRLLKHLHLRTCATQGRMDGTHWKGCREKNGGN